MHGSLSTRGLLLVVSGLLLVAVGVGSALGAIPNPGDGRFYACFNKSTGAMRVINFPKVGTCPKGQKLIDWGRTGPQGPQGVQGVQGVGGPQGLQGLQGAPGSAGITKIKLETVTGELQLDADGGDSTASAICPAGKVVGGGFSQPSYDVLIADSRPDGLSSWRVSARNNNETNDRIVTIYAVCMTTDPGTVIAKAPGFKIAKKAGRR